ncbi:hypothetical protein BJV74DRAFT_794184 [Russula compacta]|nr:hypothetical protein BJV74DRAFT_794184 [Russula compacta]
MAVSVFDNQLVENWITGPPMGGSLETGWPQAFHITRQMLSGSHEGAPHLRYEFCDIATHAGQDMEATDSSGIPPCLRRKLMRHDDRSSRANRCCKALEGIDAMTLPSAVSGDSEDWLQPDNRGDEDKDEAQPGVARSGEDPPRVRWFQERRPRRCYSSATPNQSSPTFQKENGRAPETMPYSRNEGKARMSTVQ